MVMNTQSPLLSSSCSTENDNIIPHIPLVTDVSGHDHSPASAESISFIPEISNVPNSFSTDHITASENSFPEIPEPDDIPHDHSPANHAHSPAPTDTIPRASEVDNIPYNSPSDHNHLPAPYPPQETDIISVTSGSSPSSALQSDSSLFFEQHPMVTRAQQGIHKPNPRYALVLERGDIPAEPHNLLHYEFAMKDLGSIHHFLGIEIQRHNNSLHLSQVHYAYSILDKTQMLDCKPMTTPMESKTKGLLDNTPYSDPTFYRSIVGALQYLTLTRPDLSFCVNYVSQFLQSPSLANMKMWHCTKAWRFLSTISEERVPVLPSKFIPNMFFLDLDLNLTPACWSSTALGMARFS
ncbi:hypothetical protein SADUNF_Sadunf01G0014100 [Salix dunnii]|uniref:Reverse transcriptase Ty1/copia-type domain-containing protein n=1 Tax=Salix dunnii TaxID=1413687 RepID=A0A835N9D6_9ROSI|nr:hypothetical protein SADUNF_Sadunf01G0014100 [Salix dunnii]